MVMPDVNVLVYAHRSDSKGHQEFAAWLKHMAESSEPFGLSELACVGFLRIVTNPRIFNPPAHIGKAREFIAQLRSRSNCRALRPGPANWDIFQQLLVATQAAGNLLTDAYHAALAIEHGCELITVDSDFARFPGLRWRHPFQAAAQ